MITITEILSPARDMASLNSAINNGANSVYIGIQGYNMRANAANFSMKDLKNTVKHCHNHGVKIYVCTNTVMKEQDIKAWKEMMPQIKASKADAVIVSDLGAVKIANENKIPVHMSVQANLCNSEALKILKDLGVTRVILSRELSLTEIKTIAKTTDIEIEVFVHGAMCMAISGRCFLSAHLYNKGANCGECLQPCRKQWKIISEDNEELILNHEQGNPTNETDNISYHDQPDTRSTPTHIFSPKDLCMVEHIPKLIEAGVQSFKIEGRARSPDYVATVTRVYSQAVKEYENGTWYSNNHNKQAKEWLNELRKVFNRGFDTGFFFKTPHLTSKSNQATSIKKDVGEVVNHYQKVSAAEIRLWHDLKVGEEIIIQGNTTGSLKMSVKSIQINGKNIEKGLRGQNIAISVEEKVRPNDIVYKILKRNN